MPDKPANPNLLVNSHGSPRNSPARGDDAQADTPTVAVKQYSPIHGDTYQNVPIDSNRIGVSGTFRHFRERVLMFDTSIPSVAGRAVGTAALSMGCVSLALTGIPGALLGLSLAGAGALVVGVGTHETDDHSVFLRRFYGFSAVAGAVLTYAYTLTLPMLGSTPTAPALEPWELEPATVQLDNQ